MMMATLPPYSSPPPLPSSSSPHPHKKRRISKSPRRFYPQSPQQSYQSSSPSLSTLAADRHASRQKLQSTWEDIIQKYSAMASDEADEIDLETGEIIIDHGHLKSLHDSTLWDPLDSERESENDEEEGDDIEIIDSFPVKIQNQAPSPKKSPIKKESAHNNLPSEEEIIQRFGEQYGRDILTYLKQRSSSSSTSHSKTHLWSGPEGEAEIFERAKEKWKVWRARRTQRTQERKFDKESFEKAVFGALTGSRRSAFEEAVFGHVEEKGEDTDEDGGFDRAAVFEKVVFGQKLAFKEERADREVIELLDDDVEDEDSVNIVEKEPDFDKLMFEHNHSSDGTHAPETFEEDENDVDNQCNATIDEMNSDDLDKVKLENPARPIPHQFIDLQDEVDEIDEDDDEIIVLPPPGSKDIINLITPSPQRPPSTTRNPPKDPSLTPIKRTRTPSSALRRSTHPTRTHRPNIISGLVIDASDQEDDFFLLTSSAHATRTITPKSLPVKRPENASPIILIDSDDTKVKCGTKGYRCTKAFCFTCIP